MLSKNAMALLWIIALIALLLMPFTVLPALAMDPNSSPTDATSSIASTQIDPTRNANSSINPEVEDILGEIWQDRVDDFTQAVEGISQNLDAILGPSDNIKQKLLAAEKDLYLLTQFQRLTRNYPIQQEDILRQMKSFKNRIYLDLQPLEDLTKEISQITIEKESLFNDESGRISNFSTNEGLSYYQQYIQSGKDLDQLNSRLVSILEPAQIRVVNLDNSIKNIEQDMTETWKNYYKSSLSDSGHGFALSAFKISILNWFELLSPVSTKSIFSYPRNLSEWETPLSRFFLTMGITLILGAIIKRNYTRFRISKNIQGLESIIHGPWLWMCVGFSLLLASTNNFGGSYLFMKLPGILMFLGGFGSFSWRLRLGVGPNSEDRPSPLGRFYPVAAIGVAILYLDCPPELMTMIWVLVLVIFLARLMLSKKIRARDDLPLLEKLSFSSAVYFFLGSLLVNILGYPRLAVLVFMILFTLVNILILATALINFGKILCIDYLSKDRNPVKHAIIQSLFIPLAFILSLVCAIPWLWTVPGSEYLIDNIIHANNELGTDSAKISRILIIVIVFFICRSLMAFGRVSIEQLPNNFPEIKKGIIPSLKILITYLIWTIFIIVSLGFIGIDVTSINIMAGGLGMVLGFGIQNIFKDMLSGLILMFGQIIVIGDMVEVGGVLGRVKSINIRTTEIETMEETVVFVPNSDLMSSQFTNLTRNSTKVRRQVAVHTAYGANIKLALKLMEEVAMKNDLILKSEPPKATLGNFGENSLIFHLYVTIDIKEVDDSIYILSILRQEIEETFTANNIPIYYPTMDIVMRRKPLKLESGI
jgi:small-conductance mechanosensitive channel